ncbi:MAG: acyl-CoA dehydrogenase [Deltaproteobacteria bacterium]|nr:acyl-CoA dehydrogenase [Deltaproteobacteria bacterium]
MAEVFAFNDEQDLIARSALDLLNDRCSFEAVREWMESEAGYDPNLWGEIAALGWLGMGIPEEFGGSGMGVTELVSVVESMGRKVFGSPFLANTLAAELVVRAGRDDQKRRWLPGLAAGEMIGCVAIGERSGSWDLADLTARTENEEGQVRLSGEKCFVLDAPNADLFLIACDHDGELAIVALERSQIPDDAMHPERIIDETRRSARLRLDGLIVPQEALLSGGNAAAALQRVQMLGALLVSAEMAGAAQGVMELTVEYLKTRVQFGKKIGSYQALKHPMVWIMVAVEHSISLLYRAATLWDTCDDMAEIETAVRMSKAMSGDCCTNAVDRAIQFHGAFGFTWDCHAQLFFRRAQWAEYTFGDAAHHRRHLADVLLAPSAAETEH